MSTACPQQYEPNVALSVSTPEGTCIYREISKNETHLYFYENLNTTTMNLPMESRKLLVKLEPCDGTVLLLIRRTWPCWPNPYSCINVRSGDAEIAPATFMPECPTFDLKQPDECFSETTSNLKVCGKIILLIPHIWNDTSANLVSK